MDTLYDEVMFLTFLLSISLQDYTITMYLNQYWKDDRLAFSTDDEVLTLSGDFAEKIWVPDTFFANDKNRFGSSYNSPYSLLYLSSRFDQSVFHCSLHL